MEKDLRDLLLAAALKLVRPERLPLGEDSLTSLSFDEFYQNWCGELPVHGRGCLWIGKWTFPDRG